MARVAAKVVLPTPPLGATIARMGIARFPASRRATDRTAHWPMVADEPLALPIAGPAWGMGSMGTGGLTLAHRGQLRPGPPARPPALLPRVVHPPHVAQR